MLITTFSYQTNNIMKNIVLLFTIIICLVSCSSEVKKNEKKSNHQTENRKIENKTETQKKLYAALIHGKIMLGEDFKTLKNTDINCSEFDITSDGKLVAYTANCDNPNKNGISREVRCADLENNIEKTLNIQTECYMGCWDNEGKFIAINFFDRGTWKVILYNVLTDKYSFVDNNDELFQPWFSPDGKYLVAHSLRKLYLYNYNNGVAKLNKTIDLERLKLGISSATKIMYVKINQQEKFILDYEEYNPEEDYPYNNLTFFDPKTFQIEKLTTNKFIYSYTVTTSGDIYYSAEEEDKFTIYKYKNAQNSDVLINSAFEIRSLCTKF